MKEQLTCRATEETHENDASVLAIPCDDAISRRHVERKLRGRTQSGRRDLQTAGADPLDASRCPRSPERRRGWRHGFYAVYTKWTKGNHFSRPHFHPNDRYIVVLQGTWWVGSGPKFDPANSIPMPAGSFITHFGKQVHWDGAKDEDAVLLITGEGPATSTAAAEEK
jgi:hypothetical protein